MFRQLPLALLAALALLLAGAASASAAPATLALGGPAADALADAGAQVSATGPGAASEPRLSLLAGDLVRDGGSAYVALTGELVVRAGRRTARLTGLELQLTGFAHLSARVGARRLALLTLDRRSGTWAVTAGSATVRRAEARLTATGARVLRQRLRRPGIAPGRLGRLTVRAAAAPPAQVVPQLPADAPAGARAIAGGTVRWAPRASWLSYLRQAEGPSAEGQATFDGTTYTLPITGGWYDGATGTAAVRTSGTVRFRYLQRGIDLALGAWSYEISGGAGNAATLIERAQHISESPDPSPVGQRAVVFTLDPSRLAPALGADGSALTWTDVPLTLAESGTTLFNAYPPGSEQGTVSIAATLAPAAG